MLNYLKNIFTMAKKDKTKATESTKKENSVEVEKKIKDLKLDEKQEKSFRENGYEKLLTNQE